MGNIGPRHGRQGADLKGPGVTARRYGFCPMGNKGLKQESDRIRSAFSNIVNIKYNEIAVKEANCVIISGESLQKVMPAS